jgi:hypothetical protein
MTAEARLVYSPGRGTVPDIGDVAGLFRFRDMQEAVQAFERVNAQYEHQRQAAARTGLRVFRRGKGGQEHPRTGRGLMTLVVSNRMG